MSSSISAAEGKRCAGFFSIACIVISSRPFGIEGLMRVGGVGSACICMIATETALSATNGSWPVSISYSMTPTE